MTKTTTTKVSIADAFPDTGRPLTDEECAALRANCAARKEREAKAEAARKRRLKRLSRFGPPPIPAHRFGHDGGLHITDGRKLSSRQEAHQMDLDAAIGALMDEGDIKSFAKRISTTPFDDIKAAAKADILAGKVNREDEYEVLRLTSGARTHNLSARPRATPEPIIGGEHLTAPQRATVRMLRSRLRDAEHILKVRLDDGSKEQVVEVARQWVETRKRALSSTMQKLGLPAVEQ